MGIYMYLIIVLKRILFFRIYLLIQIVSIYVFLQLSVRMVLERVL